MANGTVDWKKTVSSGSAFGVKNNLAFVGNGEAVVAGNVACDEPIGIHLGEKGRGVFGGRVTSPHQRVDAAATFQILRLPHVDLEPLRIERVQSPRRRQAMGE